MKAFRKQDAAPGLVLADINGPGGVAEAEVRLRVKSAGICGSDLHVDDWSRGYEWMEQHLPVTLGHEFSGEVIELGSAATRLSVGDRVTVWPGNSCFACNLCLGGYPDDCRNKTVPGLKRDGAFAAEVVVPETACFKLPDTVDFELGALTEPLCIGVLAVDTAQIQMDETVVVLGPGTIGQGLAIFARMAGAGRVIVVGMNDQHRLNTMGALGFSDRIDVAQSDLRETVRAIAPGGVDVVFEATGVARSIPDGLALLRKRGRMVLTGIHSEDASFNTTNFVRSKQRILSSHGSTPEIWTRVLRIMGRNPDLFRRMITHRLPLSQAQKGFDIARNKEASKVMLTPEEAS